MMLVHDIGVEDRWYIFHRHSLILKLVGINSAHAVSTKVLSAAACKLRITAAVAWHVPLESDHLPISQGHNYGNTN